MIAEYLILCYGIIMTSGVSATRKKAESSVMSASCAHRTLCIGCEQEQQTAELFDNLVGQRLERVRHLNAECPGRLQVDNELELGRPQHRQVSALRPP
jgi:hypothetical protein